METAREAAPEIDRLVLSVNGRMGRLHGERLLEVAREGGLDSLELLPHLGDFLLAGALTRELATVRMRYMPREKVEARLDELEGKELIARRNSALAATPALRPVLEAVRQAQGEVARQTWSGHADQVATLTPLVRRVAEAASDDHLVAVVHRNLPEPSDPYLALHTRLVTLRYVRQHDHAAAWAAHGLTPPDMVAMTRLWHEEPLESSDEALARLVTLGYARDDPPRLTPTGAELREDIEADTNRRAQETFDVLDREAAGTLLVGLRRLPGVVD